MNTNDTDTKQILDSLKCLLKKKGITYKQVSIHLGISEISVKRIFSNYDCSLSRISQICRIAESSLLELSQLAIKQNQGLNYFLTKDQEKYFSMSPYSFYLFKELYKGLTSKQLISQERISQKSLTTILLKLDQLQLIKLHENNRVQITVKGIIRPNLDGDLFQKVIKKQNIDFLETIYENIKDEDCCFQSAEVQLSSKSYKEMIQQIHELGKKFRERSFIESKTFPSKDLTDIRWLFGFLPYKTDWKK